LDIAFETSGPVTGIYGPSGSGKTTILEVVAGLVKVDHGFVRLGGDLLLDTAGGIERLPNQRGVGMVFQDQSLFPHLTVVGNLRYGEHRRNRSGPITFDRVVEVLELEPLLRRLPRRLSGGERQRVALGRALLSSPRLLLLDEPLTGLDDNLKQKVSDYFDLALREWGIQVLLVTHGGYEVRRLAHEVVSIENGRVVGQVKVADWKRQHVSD